MAKSGIAGIGIILSVVGALILVIFGILRIAGEFIEGLDSLLALDISVLGSVGSGDQVTSIVNGIIAILLGVIVLWAWKEKKVSAKGDYILWGIVFVVIGIIGGSLGGLLILVGGILIILGYFL